MASTVLKQKSDRSVKRQTTVNQIQPQKTPTIDAVAILDKLYGSPESEAYMVEELERLLIAGQVYDLRVNAKLTHAALAKKVGTTAAAIRRLEDSDYEGHQLPLLRKIAAVFGRRLELNIVPMDKKENRTTPPLPIPEQFRSE
jgi:DNA-binding XRE family transcriptional regulator